MEPVAEVDAAPAARRRSRTQPVRDTTTGEVSHWAVYDRAALAPGASIAGPAIVAEDETSTLVGRGWTCRMNGLGLHRTDAGELA